MIRCNYNRSPAQNSPIKCDTNWASERVKIGGGSVNLMNDYYYVSQTQIQQQMNLLCLFQWDFERVPKTYKPF